MRQVVSQWRMARRRRYRKPLLPGLWTVLAAFALMGCIGGVFWVFSKSTKLSRVAPVASPAVAKGK